MQHLPSSLAPPMTHSSLWSNQRKSVSSHLRLTLRTYPGETSDPTSSMRRSERCSSRIRKSASTKSIRNSIAETIIPTIPMQLQVKQLKITEAHSQVRAIKLVVVLLVRKKSIFPINLQVRSSNQIPSILVQLHRRIKTIISAREAKTLNLCYRRMKITCNWWLKWSKTLFKWGKKRKRRRKNRKWPRRKKKRQRDQPHNRIKCHSSSYTRSTITWIRLP